MLRAINFFTLAFCHNLDTKERFTMTIHTMPTMNTRVCPSCGGEAEYLGALLDMSGQEEREYLFWKCLDCRQMWQTKKKGV